MADYIDHLPSLHTGSLTCALTVSATNHFTIQLSVQCDDNNLDAVTVLIPSISVSQTLSLTEGKGAQPLPALSVRPARHACSRWDYLGLE